MTQFLPIGFGVECKETAWNHRAQRIFSSPGLLKLVAILQRQLMDRRFYLLSRRHGRQELFDGGAFPGFEWDHPSSHSNWQVQLDAAHQNTPRVILEVPAADSKKVQNLLNEPEQNKQPHGLLLDFGDSLCPSWENILTGYLNLMGIGLGEIFSEQGSTDQNTCKFDASEIPSIMIGCRGLSLDESHLRVDGNPLTAGILDLAVSSFWCSRLLVEKGQTPYFSIPKIESFQEAKWWNFMVTEIEKFLGLKANTIKVDIRIETLSACFQMEEILFEFKDRAAYLTGNLMGKLCSDIKTLMHHQDRIFPDWRTVTSYHPWIDSYRKKLISICHTRNLFALETVDVRISSQHSESELSSIGHLLEQKVVDGVDGCKIRSIKFVETARKSFADLTGLNKRLHHFSERPTFLPEPANSPRSHVRLRENIHLSLVFLKHWWSGISSFRHQGLLLDQSVFELCKTQCWQWLIHGVRLDEGDIVQEELINRIFDEELKTMLSNLKDSPIYSQEPKKISTLEVQYRHACELGKELFTDIGQEILPIPTTASDAMLNRSQQQSSGIREIRKSQTCPKTLEQRF